MQAGAKATGTASQLWVPPAKAGPGTPPGRSHHAGRRVGNGTSAVQHRPAQPHCLQQGLLSPTAGARHPPALLPTCRLRVPTFNFSLQSTARSRAALRGSPHGSLQSGRPEHADGGCSYTLMLLVKSSSLHTVMSRLSMASSHCPPVSPSHHLLTQF